MLNLCELWSCNNLIYYRFPRKPIISASFFFFCASNDIIIFSINVTREDLFVRWFYVQFTCLGECSFNTLDKVSV